MIIGKWGVSVEHKMMMVREWCLVTFVKCGSIHGIDDSETVLPLLICLFWML